MKKSKNNIQSSPLIIVLIYFTLGVLWILFSDSILFSIISEPESIKKIQIFKGWFYVSASAALLYYLIKKEMNALKNERFKVETERQKFKMLFDSNPKPLIVYDLKTLNILTVNKAAEIKYGWDLNEFINLAITQLMAGENARRFIMEIRKKADDYLMKGAYRHKGKSGKVIDVEIDSHKIVFEEKEGALLIVSDVTDQKNKQFEQDRKISILTSPSLDIVESLKFEDIFDVKEIQTIQDAFSKATGVASIITDVNGIPITNPSNFCRLCKDIIRKTETGLANCYHSDSIIGGVNPKGPIIQPCLSGGLWDGGASISVGDKHIANWLIGQVVDESIDKNKILDYADRIKVDREEFKKALDEVPRMSKEKFNDICDALFIIAKQLSKLAFDNIQQARYINELKKADEALKESEFKYRRIFESFEDVYFQADMNGIVQIISPSSVKLLGRSPSEIIGTQSGEYYADKEGKDKLLEVINREGVVSDYEVKLLHKDGRELYISINAKLIFDFNGQKIGVSGILRDISQRKMIELKNIESIKRAEKESEFLSSILKSHYIASGDVADLTKRLCESASNILGIDRVSAWFLSEGKTILECANLYEKDGGKHSSEYKLYRDQFIPEFKALKETPYIAAEDSRNDPRLINYSKDYLEPYNIFSSLEAVISHSGNELGVFCFESVGKKRKWEQDEILFACMLADQIAISISNQERLLTEKALKENEEKLKSIFKAVPVGIGVVDNRKFIEANENLCEMLGYLKYELIGKNTRFLYPDEAEYNRIYGMYEQVKKYGIGAIETMWKTKNGDIINILLNSSVIDKNNINAGITVTALNITDFKKAQEQSLVLSKAVDQSPIIALITDENGNIKYVNKSFCDKTGYSAEEVLGKNPRLLKSGKTPMKVYENLWLSLKEGKSWHGEFINKKKNSEEYIESAIISPIIDEKGKIRYFIAVKEDITERKMMEIELIEEREKALAADKLKSEFLAQMSHEIRTPINVLLSFSSLIQGEVKGKIDPELEESFSAINSAGDRIIRTIDQILNMSELNIGTFTPTVKTINIKEKFIDSIEGQFKYLAEQKKLKLKIIYKTENLEIISDEYSVGQILINLIDNAIKYTDAGSVEVKIFDREEKWLRIDIKDTGIGISKEYLTKIFEPFSQEEQGYNRRYEGNGLGLALVKKYCDINGIFISVKSKKNIGTTFSLAFPRFNALQKD